MRKADMDEMTAGRWKLRVQGTEATKAHTKDLSKLFYVYHQNVKEVITRPTTPRIQEVSAQIDNVLRGTENLQDPFILTLTKENNIKSFQASFRDLSGMLKTTMKLRKQKEVVNNLIRKRAFSATEFKNYRKLNNITEQIKDSGKRLELVKAGQALEKVIQQPIQRASSADRCFHPSVEFKEKRDEIEAFMRGFIVRRSSVDCKIVGKKEKLGEYFSKRKQFTDLCLGQTLQQSRPPKQIIVQICESEESTQEETHFMTELNVKTNAIERPIVRANVQRIVDIVNQKLLSDRRCRRQTKNQQLRDLELARLADIGAESVRRQKSRVPTDQPETKGQTQDKWLRSTQTGSSIKRRFYLENAPDLQNYEGEAQMARKLSSRRF